MPFKDKEVAKIKGREYVRKYRKLNRQYLNGRRQELRALRKK